MKTLFIIIIGVMLSVPSFAQQKITAQFPKAAFAGKSGGEITADEIIKAGELLPTNSELKVKSFSLTFVNDKKDLYTLKSNSNKLNANMISYLKNLKSGQKFFVEDIETVKSDGAVIKLESLTFTIKD